MTFYYELREAENRYYVMMFAIFIIKGRSKIKYSLLVVLFGVDSLLFYGQDRFFYSENFSYTSTSAHM